MRSPNVAPRTKMDWELILLITTRFIHAVLSDIRAVWLPRASLPWFFDARKLPFPFFPPVTKTFATCTLAIHAPHFSKSFEERNHIGKVEVEQDISAMSIPRRSLTGTPRREDAGFSAPTPAANRPPQPAMSAMEISRCVRDALLQAFRTPDVIAAFAEALVPFITRAERGRKRGRPLKDDADEGEEEEDEDEDRRTSRGLEADIMKARQDVGVLMDAKGVRILPLNALI